MDELQELDLHLDDYAEFTHDRRWHAWQRWTFAWVVLFAFAFGGGVMVITLMVSGEAFNVGLLVEAGLLMGLGVTTLGGWRARRRWAAAYRLRHGEGP